MIKIILINYRDEQKTMLEYPTHAQGLKAAMEALRFYQATARNWESMPPLEINNMVLCDDH